MKITSYSYSDFEQGGWRTSTVKFGNLNLIVGISGSGKTRLLNTISNIGKSVRGKVTSSGCWKVSFRINDNDYDWDIRIKISSDNKAFVEYESLTMTKNGSQTLLAKRENNAIVFNNKILPKLANDESVISLFKEEELIKPLYDSFQLFIRREFSIQSLQEASRSHVINFERKKQYKTNKDLITLFNIDSLNDRLDVLSNNYKDIFETICEYYISIFPFVKSIEIKKTESPFGIMPVFCIKEHNVDKWIPLSELSSGMQKVIFMITDICSLPDGSIYFIDEYENSLGLNAIDFLPDFLAEAQSRIQFFVTSHHPYLINNIPVNNWYVCFRKGQQINIKYGDELADRFGKSKQKAYMNLINDDIYSKGIE